MTPLLFPRLFSAGGKRSYSFLASSSAASSKKATRLRLPEILILSSNAAQQHQYDKSFSRPIATESICRLFSTSSSPSFLLLTSAVTYRKFSKYASVDHSSAYTDAIHSAHGRQLQLALEEGRGKDDAPFDPFSAFLDQMGQTDDADDGNNENGNRDGDGNEIEEAEFEEYDNQEEEYDDNNENQPRYDTTGAPHRPKSERLALRAGYPAGGTFAVISLAGFQHKVTKDDLLVVNKLKPVSCWSVGSTHTIKGDDVLLVSVLFLLELLSCNSFTLTKALRVLE